MQKSYSNHFGAPIRNSNFRAKLEEAVLCDDSNILCECRPPCRSFLYYGDHRYSEEMAGTSWRQRRSTVDGDR
jgi:hypothetical protein